MKRAGHTQASRDVSFSATAGRVNQLDALRLDAEFAALMAHGVAQSVAPLSRASPLTSLLPEHISLSELARRLAPEMQLMLRSVYFALSVARDTPSPGNRYQNVRYKASMPWSRKAALFACSVLARYVFARLSWLSERWLARELQRPQETGSESSGSDSDSESDSGTRRSLRERGVRASVVYAQWLSDALRFIEKVFACLHVLNMMVFLRQGRYRSLEDRVAGTRLEYIELRAQRSLGFELLNQALVWEGFSEFVLFLFPLFRPAAIARVLKRLIGWFLSVDLGALEAQRRSRQGRSSSSVAPVDEDDTGESVAAQVCAKCQSSKPTMAHRVDPCGCVFCYACIAIHTESDALDSDECLNCGSSIRSVTRIQAEWIEDITKKNESA
ncbi:Peroxisome biogenesis factor 2 [Porphyridium purpureum]|uniref:RING-type E3 ubiquitin transferase (cysteine targeting) n=1 Tax=Porphyridium purpureum TaxID=35688 RepID=A0A5J4Z928_PORPP|nr:Peroxisome biogenesis factor 2 [Porphyridium purpureum]|eukprot:POR8365..scf295_1